MTTEIEKVVNSGMDIYKLLIDMPRVLSGEPAFERNNTMNIPNSFYHRRRFPSDVIAYAVFAYHRFALSLRDVEDLFAERGVTVSYETIRIW